MRKSKLSVPSKLASELNQHRLAITLKFSVIAIAVIAFYFQDLSIVFKGALVDESMFHILAIPFIFAYLLYRKRKMINASLQPYHTEVNSQQKNFSTIAGSILFVIAVFIYWYGSYTFTPLEYHMITLPFLVAGLILILFNFQTLKQLIFPIAFLIFLTPPPAEILYSVGSALANLSASLSNFLANMFGLHSVLSSSNVGPIITLMRPDQTTLPFNIDVACSGIYSIIGFVIFALFIAYITAGGLRNKFAILALGIPLILSLNVIRITIILAIGYNYGEDLALQIFHTVGATVLMFIGTLVLLAVTEKAFKKPKSSEPCPTCNPTPNPTQSFCLNCGKLLKYPKTKLDKNSLAKIIAIVLVTITLLSIQSPVFALTQGPAQVMIRTPSGIQVGTSNSSLPFPEINGYALNYVYRDLQIEKTAGDDAALVYAYHTSNETASTAWAALQISSSVTSEHRWETCLITMPMAQGLQSPVQQVDLRDVQIQNNPPIMARYFAFEYKNTNQTQVVLYWYEKATFNVNGTAETKYVMISIVMYPSLSNISKAEDQELPIALAINNYWQPIKTWSVASLIISQNGLELSSIATAFLVLLILYSLYADKKQKHSLLLSYKKLSEENQYLIKAIENITDKKNITTQAIINEFQKVSPEPLSQAFVLDKLSKAENAGLIKKILTKKDDIPILLWKNQIST